MVCFRTRGRKMVGADETMELLRTPTIKPFYVGGQVVSMLAFYSNDQSLNSGKDSFSVNFLKRTKKILRDGPLKIYGIMNLFLWTCREWHPVKNIDGTESFSASWSYSGCSAASGSNRCGTACTSRAPPASPTSWPRFWSPIWSSSTCSWPSCSAAFRTWEVSIFFSLIIIFKSCTRCRRQKEVEGQSDFLLTYFNNKKRNAIFKHNFLKFFLRHFCFCLCLGSLFLHTQTLPIK